MGRVPCVGLSVFPTCSTRSRDRLETSRAWARAPAMAAPSSRWDIDTTPFRDLSPSRFVSFTLPAPDPSSILLRAAVLDSTTPPPTPVPKVAALVVPDGRHSDWIFSTEPGHRQLLLGLADDISRLILVGDLPHHPAPAYYSKAADVPAAFHELLLPLCLLLSPAAAFAAGIPDVAFISYEDDLVCSLRVATFTGPVVGDLLVEDVEVESGRFRFRRRLRFKRMPNLVQTEVALVPRTMFSAPRLGGTSFRPDTTALAMPYLAAMASGLLLVAPTMERLARPRVLCVGVGGGSLPMFLSTHFELDVVGVEIDATVVDVAKEYFGLVENEFIRVRVGDGIELLKNPTRLGLLWSDGREDGAVGEDCLVDVMMVDLDSSDVRRGMSAPPPDFLQVLKGARSVLSENGVLIVNVITGDQSFRGRLLGELRSLFAEVYEMDVENVDNVVVMASASAVEVVEDEGRSCTRKKLWEVLGGDYLKLWNQI